MKRLSHPRAPRLPARGTVGGVAVAGVAWGALIAAATQESLRADPWTFLFLLLLAGMVATAFFACTGRRELGLAAAFTMFATPTLITFACTPLNEVTGLVYLAVSFLALLPVVCFFVTVCLRWSVLAGLKVLLPLLTLHAVPVALM